MMINNIISSIANQKPSTIYNGNVCACFHLFRQYKNIAKEILFCIARSVLVTVYLYDCVGPKSQNNIKYCNNKSVHTHKHTQWKRR